MKIKDILRVIVTPTCWVRIDQYSKIWDAELNRLLDTCKITNIDEYSVMIGGKRIWIANHPYGSGSIVGSGITCARTTAFRLWDETIKAIVFGDKS